MTITVTGEELVKYTESIRKIERERLAFVLQWLSQNRVEYLSHANPFEQPAFRFSQEKLADALAAWDKQHPYPKLCPDV